MKLSKPRGIPCAMTAIGHVLPLPTGCFRASRSAMLALLVCSQQNPSVRKLAPTGHQRERSSGVAHFVGSNPPWFGITDLNMKERK
jgi:hypothetical protein